MGLDPALEKFGRNGEAHRVAGCAFEFHAGKPPWEDDITDFGTQSFFDALPTLLVFVRNGHVHGTARPRLHRKGNGRDSGGTVESKGLVDHGYSNRIW